MEKFKFIIDARIIGLNRKLTQDETKKILENLNEAIRTILGREETSEVMLYNE